jgi:metallo-beta-lactamase family protein
LQDIDYLIMESTYGLKTHRPPGEALSELTALIKATVERGGKIIIPSFAVGRAQELIYELHQLINRKEIPPLPVYVDSPLAVNTVGVFRAHVELFDEESQALIRSDRFRDALGFATLNYTKSVDESKAINDQKGPLIIISASGMCESGRILHHLRNNIEDPRNTILIVSWQAPDTLGRRLADREKEVRIFGETFAVKAQVATINGYSGHAGSDFLIQWATALKPRLKKVFVVHGEPASSQAVAEALKAQGVETYIPALHETVAI